MTGNWKYIVWQSIERQSVVESVQRCERWWGGGGGTATAQASRRFRQQVGLAPLRVGGTAGGLRRFRGWRRAAAVHWGYQSTQRCQRDAKQPEWPNFWRHCNKRDTLVLFHLVIILYRPESLWNSVLKHTTTKLQKDNNKLCNHYLVQFNNLIQL